MVLDEGSQRVIDKTGNPSCTHSIPRKGVGDIIFTATRIYLEYIRELNALMTRRA
jgi:hypothetical protein